MIVEKSMAAQTMIKNRSELAITSLRTQALDIIEVGISRVLPTTIMKNAVKFDPANRILSINNEDFDVSKGRLFVIGGGSALMPCPVDEISLEDKQEMTRLLIEKGPSIQEINAVRKHLSKTKGGRLGKFFSPTRVVSLIISDVIGNDLDTIASGPTVPDSTTFQDSIDVLYKYDLLSKAPKRIVDYLEKGRAVQIEETPKRRDNCRNFIIGDIRLALEAMAAKTKEWDSNLLLSLPRKKETLRKWQTSGQVKY